MGARVTDQARQVSWIKSARKVFEQFPATIQLNGLRALAIAAAGRKADQAKPLRGFDDNVLEIVLRHQGNAYRVVYVLQLDEDIWVIHAFQKKSTQGKKTPKPEMDLVRDRIKRLKEALQQ